MKHLSVYAVYFVAMPKVHIRVYLTSWRSLGGSMTPTTFVL